MPRSLPCYYFRCRHSDNVIVRNLPVFFLTAVTRLALHQLASSVKVPVTLRRLSDVLGVCRRAMRGDAGFDMLSDVSRLTCAGFIILGCKLHMRALY